MIPPEWYGGDLSALEVLVERLLARRARVRELIVAFRESARQPFPNWGAETEKSNGERIGGSGNGCKMRNEGVEWDENGGEEGRCRSGNSASSNSSVMCRIR